MTLNGWLQIFVFLALVFLVTKPLGVFMARVFNREKTFMDPVLRPVERLLYRVTGVDENHEMRWTEYAVAMLLFSLVSMIVLYLMQRLQAYLPFNPQKFGAVSPTHAAQDARIGDPCCRDFQCSHYRRVNSAGITRCEIPADGSSCVAARQLVDLRIGRHYRALHRY